MHPQNSRSLERLTAFKANLGSTPLSVREGRLTRVSGLVYEVHGLPMTIGDRATINLGGDTAIEAECIGFNGGTTFLMPVDPTEGISPGAPVYPLGTPYFEGAGFKVQNTALALPLGESLLGRVVDGFGRLLMAKGSIPMVSRACRLGE